ncbi:hypothetical protein [Maribacter aestuarii]|uniref:hypothetical protein n=1 Tax=Maribacter aestuarii TaxID=1130723 RepID=UPI00248CA1AC|nr:hypothetical protein [Maribacter aestuarii]
MRIILFISVFSISLISCEKEDNVVANFSGKALVGTWSRVDEIPSGLSEADFRYFDMKTTQIFRIDGSHSYKVDFYGFKDENPNEIIGQTENTGSFEVKSDSVFIRAFENTSWESGFSSEPTTTILTGETYGSRFEINGKTLTLFYISYPADAPVAKQMSYQRVD